MPPTSNFQIDPSLAKRVRARAQELGMEFAELLNAVINVGLDGFEPGWGESGDRLVEATLAPGTLGVFFRDEQDENGERDADATARVREEFESLLRQHNFDGEVVSREFEVGIGAQGEPASLLQLLGICFTVAAGPAVLINQWKTAAPAIREWLAKRGRKSGVTLELVKRWCMEDAQSRVDNPDQIVPRFVTGHRGSAYTGSMDSEAIGPYCVSVQIPEIEKTFVYITDELGQILQRVEVPGPGLDEVFPEDNAPKSA